MPNLLLLPGAWINLQSKRRRKTLRQWIKNGQHLKTAEQEEKHLGDSFRPKKEWIFIQKVLGCQGNAA